MEIKYDITTSELAKQFVFDFFNRNKLEVNLQSECFEDCWKRYKIKAGENASKWNNIKIVMIHITSSSDECYKIKKEGLKTLQKCLMENLEFKEYLLAHGIEFDVKNQNMKYYQRSFQIEKFNSIYSRIYNDSCINAYLFNDNIRQTIYYKYPEFFLTLVSEINGSKRYCYFDKLITDWEKRHRGYIVKFYAYLNQIKQAPFYSDGDNTDIFKIEKQMLKIAFERSNSERGKFDSDQEVVCLKETEQVLPEQIIACTPISNYT